MQLNYDSSKMRTGAISEDGYGYSAKKRVFSRIFLRKINKIECISNKREWK